MWRYGATLLFFLTLGIVYISVVYAVPTATITLYPDIESVSVTRQIVADPQLESVNFSGASVPARRLVVIEEWQAGVETTGVIEVPDAPASGTVVFVNRRAIALPFRLSMRSRCRVQLGQQLKRPWSPFSRARVAMWLQRALTALKGDWFYPWK
jgi:hypothetical protein